MDQVHYRIQISVLTANNIIDLGQILMFNFFQNFGFVLLINLVLYASPYPLDDNIHIQTFFMGTEEIAHARLTVQRFDVIIILSGRPQFQFNIHDFMLLLYCIACLLFWVHCIVVIRVGPGPTNSYPVRHLKGQVRRSSSRRSGYLRFLLFLSIFGSTVTVCSNDISHRCIAQM